MKKIIITLFIIVALNVAQEATAQPGISFNTFYTELSPYGRWIDYPDYGQVWIANQTGFEPYATNGHWVYTTYGWTWVSDYDWGWAPFHYGRWAYINSHGWAWIPGYEWAPAWVSWCNYGGYYGWAPLSPGLGINIGFNSIPINRWRFVRHQYITNANVYRHHERPLRNAADYKNVTVINNTQVNNNVTYVSGPQRQEVERVTRKKIVTKDISFTQTAQRAQVEKKQVRLYRPEQKAAAEAGNTQPDLKTNPANEQPVKADRSNTKPALADKEKSTELKRQQVAQEKSVNTAPAKVQQVPAVKNRQQEALQRNNEDKNRQLRQQQVQQEQVKRQQELEQRKLQQQNELERNKEEQSLIKRQQAEEQQVQRQNELNRRKEEQTLLKKQQAEEQQLQRQNELNKQREQQDIKRQQEERRQAERQQAQQQQNELKKQQLQEEQMRQREQRQEQMRREREQRVLPQQPAGPPPAQPSRPTKRG